MGNATLSQTRASSRERSLSHVWDLASRSSDQVLAGDLRVNPEPSLKSLFDARPNESFSQHQAIFWQGDEAGDVLLVTKGCLQKCCIVSDEGRRAILGFSFAG